MASSKPFSETALSSVTRATLMPVCLLPPAYSL
jgi:hypothetical protein